MGRVTWVEADVAGHVTMHVSCMQRPSANSKILWLLCCHPHPPIPWAGRGALPVVSHRGVQVTRPKFRNSSSEAV